MTVLREKFENRSLEELRDLSQSTEITSVELIIVKNLIREREKVKRISVEEINDKITSIIESENKKAQQILRKLIDNVDDYENLVDEVREKIMNIQIDIIKSTNEVREEDVVNKRNSQVDLNISGDLEETILLMLKEGKSVKEVRRHLQCQYSKVYWIMKKYKKSLQ